MSFFNSLAGFFSSSNGEVSSSSGSHPAYRHDFAPGTPLSSAAESTSSSVSLSPSRSASLKRRSAALNPEGVDVEAAIVSKRARIPRGEDDVKAEEEDEESSTAIDIDDADAEATCTATQSVARPLTSSLTSASSANSVPPALSVPERQSIVDELRRLVRVNEDLGTATISVGAALLQAQSRANRARTELSELLHRQRTIYDAATSLEPLTQKLKTEAHELKMMGAELVRAVSSPPPSSSSSSSLTGSNPSGGGDAPSSINRLDAFCDDYFNLRKAYHLADAKATILQS